MASHSDGPRIGIAVPRRAAEHEQQRRNDRNMAAYRRALEAAGARVTVVLPGGGEVLGSLDGLLLTGGGDIDPKWYGERDHPRLGRIDAERDELEIALARVALRSGVPLLGVCRGAQVLGVAAGGKLLQDIPSAAGEGRAECRPTRPYGEHSSKDGEPATRHWVSLADGSRLREILGAPRVRVNSYHHQANAVLGDGLAAVAWSDDGIIEGIEASDGRFAIGVQWHPERMPRSARQRRLFAAFVAAATV